VASNRQGLGAEEAAAAAVAVRTAAIRKVVATARLCKHPLEARLDAPARNAIIPQLGCSIVPAGHTRADQSVGSCTPTAHCMTADVN
jgi:hypothetical protein